MITVTPPFGRIPEQGPAPVLSETTRIARPRRCRTPGRRSACRSRLPGHRRRGEVHDLAAVDQGQVAVGAPLGDVQHVARSAESSSPIPRLECRRRGTKVQCNVVDRAARAPHQLHLGVRRPLVVHAPQRARARAPPDVRLDPVAVEAVARELVAGTRRARRSRGRRRSVLARSPDALDRRRLEPHWQTPNPLANGVTSAESDAGVRSNRLLVEHAATVDHGGGGRAAPSSRGAPWYCLQRSRARRPRRRPRRKIVRQASRHRSSSAPECVTTGSWIATLGPCATSRSNERNRGRTPVRRRCRA